MRSSSLLFINDSYIRTSNSGQYKPTVSKPCWLYHNITSDECLMMQWINHGFNCYEPSLAIVLARKLWAPPAVHGAVSCRDQAVLTSWKSGANWKMVSVFRWSLQPNLPAKYEPAITAILIRWTDTVQTSLIFTRAGYPQIHEFKLSSQKPIDLAPQAPPNRETSMDCSSSSSVSPGVATKPISGWLSHQSKVDHKPLIWFNH